MRSVSFKLKAEIFPVPSLTLLRPVLFDRKFLLYCIGAVLCVNIVMLASYLVVFAALVHDEKGAEYVQAHSAVLRAQEERLTVALFGEEYMHALKEHAAALGLVPIGKAAYLVLPSEPFFAKSIGP